MSGSRPSARLEAAVSEFQLTCVLGDSPDLPVAEAAGSDRLDVDGHLECHALDRRQRREDLVIELLEIRDDPVRREILATEVARVARQGARPRWSRSPAAGGRLPAELGRSLAVPVASRRCLFLALNLRPLGLDDKR